MGRRAFLAGLAVVPMVAPTAAPARVADLRRPDEAIEQIARGFLAANPECPGVAIGYIKEQNGYAGGFGRIAPERSATPDAHTIYPIASISKTFTGVVLAQLALEGRLSLDDDVRMHLAGDYSNLSFDGEPIRLWHLLNHVSGLPFNLPDLPSTRPPFPPPDASESARIAAYTRADLMRDLAGIKLAVKPGTSVAYSNAAVVLLSLILEGVAEAPFDSLVKDRICRSLGMSDTGIGFPQDRMDRVAPGHDEAGKIAPPLDVRLLGAGAITSTVQDMLAYARWHMEEADPAVRLSHAPHPIADNFAVGLNWQMMSGPNGRCIWQEGSLPGYASMCVALPESRAAFVAFINKQNPPTNQAFGRLARQMLAVIAPGATTLP